MQLAPHVPSQIKDFLGLYLCVFIYFFVLLLFEQLYGRGLYPPPGLMTQRDLTTTPRTGQDVYFRAWMTEHLALPEHDPSMITSQCRDGWRGLAVGAPY